MYTIDNKFEIGEECYSVYRKPIHYKCPICDGNGKFEHNGYDIWCRNYNGSGKLHNSKQFTMDVCKVRVRRIIASIYGENITIKYKVDCIDDDFIRNNKHSINNRGENNLFKTAEEAKSYCDDVNTEKVRPEF